MPACRWSCVGRYQGMGRGKFKVEARDALGQSLVARSSCPRPAKTRRLAPLWARGRIRDLEDRYASGDRSDEKLEAQIVATSLRFGVLCRFTAFVAVDRSAVVNQGGQSRTIVQPVELPQGWEAQQVPAFTGFGFCSAPLASSS